MSMSAQRLIGSVRIPVTVLPEACGDEVAGWADGALRIHVMAESGRGQANFAVEMLLAEVLRIAHGQVNVVRGHSTAQKMVQIDGFDEQDLDRELPGRVVGELELRQRGNPPAAAGIDVTYKE
jgi:uncharacterized protein YggU (UPF0235/DUF167 family)